MANEQNDERKHLRWLIYALLIALALGQAAGKILAVNSVDRLLLEQRRISQAVERFRQSQQEKGIQGDKLDQLVAKKQAEYEERLKLQRPFLSANDRSRWMSIRALAEYGDFEIERFFEEPTWDTIDMVQHPGRDGALHLYSSKPTLLSVLLTGPYWLVIQSTGMTLGTHPYEVGRFLLLLINGGALCTLMIASAAIIERIGEGDFGRIFAVGCLSHATMLSAFMPVLNNHLIAAALTAVVCYLWIRLQSSEQTHIGVSFLAGIAAGLLAASELPALVLAGVVTLVLSAARFKETLLGYLPGLLIMAGLFFATNYWAHNTIYPPYAFRSTTNSEANWYKFEYTVNGKTRQSYWHQPRGVDRGEKSPKVYAFHSLVGHHGLFSITPVWLLSVVGGSLLLMRSGSQRTLAWITLFVTLACLIFYLGTRPQQDRNYGGMTSGFRWLFWLAPLWAALLPAAAERMKTSRLGLAVCLVLVGLSVMSASYPTWNPWTHPWLYIWLEHLGFDL